MRDEKLLCSGWEFCCCEIGTEFKDASGWQAVDLPHDWLIYDTKDLYKTSTGWYRRVITVPEDGRRTALRFDGVYMDCRIYVNGRQAFEWKYGYTSFECDITEYLKGGENLVAVRVDHREPNSRWYSGAGIYRKVRLVRYEEQHILSNGVYISAAVDGTVTVTTETERPAGETAADLSLRTVITRFGGEGALCELTSACCAADRSVLPQELVKDGRSYTVNDQKLRVEAPALWDITAPALYVCTVSLLKNGEERDRISVRFGFRSCEMTADRGFILNGRQLKLHGVCEHHDLGALGAAVNKSAIIRKLNKLRLMGVNAIRTSHNPPAPEFLEAAEERGFLILDEFLDMWELKKTDYDYARFFPRWVRRDAASWVRRDRNHPCVIGWSIGNEIYDTHFSERGQEVTSLLKSLVQQHDPRGNGFVTIGSNYMGSETAQRCADILKNAGYNYAERLYDEHHRAHPDWHIYGSETSSIVQSRGIYHFPADKPVLSEDDEQCSALGNSTPAWAAKCWEANIIPDRDAEYCAGQFIWTGFDYIGEPTPYSTKNSYFGQIDTAGYYKDSAYVYRAAWTDGRKNPFIHLFPYWDWSEGEEIDILATTNCHEARLFADGREIARKTFGDRPTELTVRAKLPYSAGEITAVAYDKAGREAARDSVRSFGDGCSIQLVSDRASVPAGSEELIFIDITARDREGSFVANARDRVTVEVSGAGRLIGLDNGDSTDYEQYKGISRRLFSGRLLAIVAPKEEAGEINVKVTSPSLGEAHLTLTAEDIPELRVEGISFTAENTERPLDCASPERDIPPRKLELSAEERCFTPERSSIRVNVRLLPENTTCREVEYRVATAAGITSPLARITEQDDSGVTVTALGDGEFFLRATSRCGTERTRIISQLRLTAEGLGSALIDPYELVAGGLYSVSGGEVTNGIQHGAGIGRGGGWFGFENVDFGPLGSDTMTLPLFANYSTPVGIRVYDGRPDQGGELIGDFIYDLKPIWLTYQPKTYKLKKLLKGVHTLVIQSDMSYDVQGFCFERRRKETAELSALEAESIYGDSFTRTEDAVIGIGNNVTIDLGKFSFDKAPERVIITGRSKLPVNSIHLQSEGAESRRWQLEFEGCEEYTARAFPIEGMESECKISLFFLPGCDFDLKSVRFE
ncbi:MAG: DUF4982 domain-containing protein [Ruminococcus sp.]|nr:DUF4982 domain-containing protein [Ruminococcus sp.]